MKTEKFKIISQVPNIHLTEVDGIRITIGEAECFIHDAQLIDKSKPYEITVAELSSGCHVCSARDLTTALEIANTLSDRIKTQVRIKARPILEANNIPYPVNI